MNCTTPRCLERSVAADQVPRSPHHSRFQNGAVFQLLQQSRTAALGGTATIASTAARTIGSPGANRPTR